MVGPRGRRPARAVAHGQPAPRAHRGRPGTVSAGTRSTPFLRDTLYTGPGYERNLLLSRPGVLPFLALTIVLTWVLARRAYGEATGLDCGRSRSPACRRFSDTRGLATTDVAFTATFLLALLALLRWIEQPTWATRASRVGWRLDSPPRPSSRPSFCRRSRWSRRSPEGAWGRGPAARGGCSRHAPVMGLVAFAVVWAAYRFAVAAPASLWQPGWLDGHAARMSSVGGTAARGRMAPGPPPARASGIPRVVRAVRPGGAGAFDLIPAGAADPGRLPGVLPDRARGQDAAASHRAGGVRILRARIQPGRRGRPLPRAGARARRGRVPRGRHPARATTSACATCCR